MDLQLFRIVLSESVGSLIHLFLLRCSSLMREMTSKRGVWTAGHRTPEEIKNESRSRRPGRALNRRPQRDMGQHPPVNLLLQFAQLTAIHLSQARPLYSRLRYFYMTHARQISAQESPFSGILGGNYTPENPSYKEETETTKIRLKMQSYATSCSKVLCTYRYCVFLGVRIFFFFYLSESPYTRQNSEGNRLRNLPVRRTPFGVGFKIHKFQNNFL